ncbi:MAG: M23 family metallopeptidase [Chloroflexi bacterium]|nr:M23 family metallopeptidase [Chloroflexota bacterium]
MIRRFFARIRRWPWWVKSISLLIGLGCAVCGAVAALIGYSQTQTNSSGYINRWFDERDQRDELATVQREPCPGAPFVLPSDGLIGLLWRDSAAPYNVLRRHTGIDIFGDGQLGEVPVYAAFDGYLTRRPDWVSSVIISHDDPLHPGETIWTYYTHMASQDGDSYVVEDFPPGTAGVWVEQGTLLGYQGNYSGGRLPVGLHLHFSIVTSEADGSFKNESNLDNTLDPSPYLGMNVNIDGKPSRPVRCMVEN